jgi:hypothetical protein
MPSGPPPPWKMTRLPRRETSLREVSLQARKPLPRGNLRRSKRCRTPRVGTTPRLEDD